MGWMIGDKIGRYTISAKLGEGGMGEVYLATDTALERQVALKFLPAALAKDAESRERLLREARAVSKLNHKNVLTMHSVESIDGRDFLVMEYVEGCTLKDMLDSGEEIAMEQILRLGLQICDGLAAAHEHSVIHRDIKPANILINPKGDAKIADFGLATWKGAGQLTKEGSTVGTAAYMSPEQVQGSAVDARSDVFSLGVVLYEMVTRNVPFKGGHDAAVAYSILNEQPEPLARYKSNVHPALQEVIDRALEKDPSTRYPNVSAMLVDLKRIRRDLEGSNPSAQSRVQSRVSVRSHKKSYLKSVIAGVAIIAIVLVVFVLKPFKFDVATEQKANAAENSLAVMYFENLADPADTDKSGEMAANLLIAGLSESRFLRVLSRQRLYDILNSLGEPGGTKIGPQTSTAIASRANVKWIVTGKVYQTSPRIVMAADVSESGTGQVVTTQRINGEPSDGVFAVIDKLGASLRSNLALPVEAQSEQTKSVADVTTHSPDAYRHYLDGVEFRRKYYTNEALASFQKAIALDSTFAMAYYHLAMLPARAIVGTAAVKEWVAKANKYSANATWKDQRYIKSVVHLWNYDGAGMIRELDLLLERYPDEKDAWIDKAFYSGQLGRYEEALICNERVVALDPTYKLGYNGLAYSYETLGQFDKAIATINKYVALAPEEANPYDSRGDLYAMNGHTREAIESYRLAMQKNPEFESDEKLYYMYAYLGDYIRADSVCRAMATSSLEAKRVPARLFISRLTAYQGQFRKALAQLDGALAADRGDGVEESAYIGKLLSKATLLIAVGRPTEAIDVAEQAVQAQARMDSELTSAATVLTLCYARAGRIDDANRTVASLQAKTLANEDTTGWQAEMAYTKGSVAFYANRVDEAIRELEQIAPRDRDATTVAILAQAYLHSSQFEKAATELERFLKFQTSSRIGRPHDGVRCFYWLGLAYEQTARKDQAAEQYRTFLDIWKNADPGIPEVEDAKARLAGMSS